MQPGWLTLEKRLRDFRLAYGLIALESPAASKEILVPCPRQPPRMLPSRVAGNLRVSPLRALVSHRVKHDSDYARPAVDREGGTDV